MLSAILSDYIKNINGLCLNQKLPLSQPVAFAEQWEEQGAPRTIRMRPTRGVGGGANFYGFDATGTQLNQMVRKVWTQLEVQCWGNPASEQDFPDPTERLLHTTDDTEALRRVAVVAMVQTVGAGAKYLHELWNTPGEVMMYGRCLTVTFALEQPIADIQPYYEEANLATIDLTGEVNA